MKKYDVEKIRAEMNKLGLSHQKMADRLGLKRRQLGRWLQGTRTPSRDLKTLDEALSVIPVLPDSEYQWSAGFIEADGCVHIGKSGGRNMDRHPLERFHILLTVTQKDVRPVKFLRQAFGGHLKLVSRKHKGRIVVYHQWTVCANRAYAALVRLLPYLKFKREQASLCIQLQKNINAKRDSGYGRYSCLPGPVGAFRRTLYLKCKRLNSKSYIEELNAASGEFGGPLYEAIPSQATEGTDPVEGVTASQVSPNNNPDQERPTRRTDEMR